MTRFDESPSAESPAATGADRGDRTLADLSAARPRGHSWRPSAIVSILALTAILACALIWRLPATNAEWRFTLCENDSLYQLLRVERCLAQYPHVQSVDAYSHHPRGYRVHWMPLHTLLYASIAELAGIAPDQRDSLVATLSWVPPLLGLVALVLVLAIARCFTDNALCMLAVGAAYAVSSDVIRPFFFGTIDHHLFAHLGVLLMVWGRLRHRLAGWVLGLIALLAMTPEGIIYVSLLLGCHFASQLAAWALRTARAPRHTWAWTLSPVAVGLIVWLLDRGLESAPLPLFDLTWMYPTLFQPLWLLVLGSSIEAGLMALAGIRSAERSRTRAFAGALAASGVVAATCAAFLAACGALQTIGARLLGGDQRLYVSEELSVFHQGFWQAPAWYRVLAFGSIIVLVKLVAGVRLRRGSTYWFKWSVLAAAFGLGFVEMRHLYVLASLQLIALGLGIFELEQALRRLPMFAARGRLWPATALALATLPFLIAADVVDRAAAHGDVCDSLPLTEELSGWLRRHTPDPADHGSALYGVFSPWSIGHQLHVLGDRPVVVDPFNYELDHWVEDALDRVWHAQTADALADALRGYGARYLVLTNPTIEIVGTRLAPIGLTRADLMQDGPANAVIFRPAMSQFASFRLFMGGGMSPEFGQLEPRYLTADSEHYRASFAGPGAAQDIRVPRGQIYEMKPGALITGVAPTTARGVTVHYTVRRGEGSAVEVEVPLALATDGRFEFRTALPAPLEADSFRVEGGYTVAVGDRTEVVRVTQEMVDSGAVVSLPPVVRTAVVPTLADR